MLASAPQGNSKSTDKGKNNMAARRILLEVGTGNDWHGGDYTKAAVRAVEDAIHHCSLTFVKSLNLDASSMLVEVTIGVQKPDQVDRAQVNRRCLMETSECEWCRAASTHRTRGRAT